MVRVPAVTPVTTPVAEVTVATEVLLLDHVPVPVSDNAVLSPVQTTVEPEMAEGSGFTVIPWVMKQPPVMV